MTESPDRAVRACPPALTAGTHYYELWQVCCLRPAWVGGGSRSGTSGLGGPGAAAWGCAAGVEAEVRDRHHLRTHPPTRGWELEANMGDQEDESQGQEEPSGCRVNAGHTSALGGSFREELRAPSCKAGQVPRVSAHPKSLLGSCLLIPTDQGNRSRGHVQVQGVGTRAPLLCEAERPAFVQLITVCSPTPGILQNQHQ